MAVVAQALGKTQALPFLAAATVADDAFLVWEIPLHSERARRNADGVVGSVAPSQFAWGGTTSTRDATRLLHVEELIGRTSPIDGHTNTLSLSSSRTRQSHGDEKDNQVSQNPPSSKEN